MKKPIDYQQEFYRQKLDRKHRRAAARKEFFECLKFVGILVAALAAIALLFYTCVGGLGYLVERQRIQSRLEALEQSQSDPVVRFFSFSRSGADGVYGSKAVINQSTDNGNWTSNNIDK